HCTIKYTKRTLYFDRKVNVSWSINDVYAMLRELCFHTTPESSRRS
ncbi:hypothetical protein D043_4258B, partial [Vibrio parahaemolyticus EKP-021]